ncbi:hypothetical protein Pst134EB_004242 [Puccinia striiformis f. sp. tritici]|nr:hypothetical protein Pst134EB_004242 [Puccinia striiformis f. sp. tritici]
MNHSLLRFPRPLRPPPTSTTPPASALTKSPKANLTSSEPAAVDAPLNALAATPPTAGEAHTPALDATTPTAPTAPEPESPTSTTTAPPAGASSKAETTPSTGGTPSKNVKDPKNKNGTHSTDKKASQSAPSPISQSTFELMTAFLSVGLLAIMV